jgi:cellulose synthase/poly-beta-1,6-N-acetylglucosamine synthase-like glycosyltransferase
MPELFLLICFALLLIFYIYFLSGIYIGLSKHSSDVQSKVLNEFVSVLIPFRNESENILKNLESIENQTYPKDKFEVIYIDDSSTDDSLIKLTKANNSSNIKIISLPENFLPNAHKKRAVRFGIENCNGEIIVTTDADCIHKMEWLGILLSFYDNETGFISGPVEFASGDSLFDKMQKIEFAGLILSGAGLIGINKPAICNAANASYRKEAYKSVNGFDDNLNLSSGDDEILMQKIWRAGKYKIKFCMNRNAVVTSLPNKSLEDFYHQRKRWASKGLYYTNKLLILKLVLLFLFYFSLLVQLILGIFFSSIFLLTFIISFLLKIIIEYIIIKKGTDLLFDKDLLKLFLITEILHIPYIIIFSIAGIFGNYQWKERKVKR